MTTLTTTPDGTAARRPVPPSAPAARSTPRQGGTVLAVPALVWYLVFMVGPMIAIFVIAALHWPGMLQPVSFAGWGNVRTVLDDPVFWDAVANTAVQLAVAVPVMIVCAYMLGYYVAQRPPGHRVIRYLLFIPGLISTPAKAMVFYAALSPDGLVNGALQGVGLGSLTDAWLASPSTALACLIALDVWSGIGFTAVLFAARLNSVPGELGEAAQLDGAGHWRTMWTVHFPVIRDYVGVVTMLQFLWTLFGSAQHVLLLTQGGPGTSSTTLSFLVYQKAFIAADLGYSQTVGVFLFLTGLVGLLAIRRVFRQTY
ncbi:MULTISPECIES: carbohydrate ABC transporter permease [Streptomyces]|uniref:Sugar ABC transporter permease n=1 Tax=Streptomyces doudnae TaxID=3075536 RepID=A0ABD5ERU0_9ACTN|nr:MULTISPECIES: sugar ABC transporter permease [unclassified Streptomyces]MDT0436565.1 sugar ABC transporter permease [Streptomyces sp. DSM 41981]MYQ63332.1 ABC transporter permease subunit [Streptomyces sp. SID4950]SCD56148.1 carbohydrate ABC transporter membrane protein 1, CUT1 family [Streptomyces sp. SolWspMP-5a-2]